MPLGLTNYSTNITIDSITDMASNITDPVEIFINMNHTIYGGNFYIILLFTLWTILFLIAWFNNNERKGLHDFSVYAMYSGAVVSIIAFFMRAIFIIRDGFSLGLISDFQLWIFPIITIIIATFVYMSQD